MSTRTRHDRLCAQLVELTPAVLNFARRLERNPIDVEDLVQDTLIKALANLDKFQEGTRLKSWLFTITKNTYFTRYSVRKRTVFGLGEDSAKHASIQAPQLWALEMTEFRRALEGLPPHYRAAVEGVLINGDSYGHAAEIGSCAVGTIKSRVNRGRRMLLEQLDPSAHT